MSNSQANESIFEALFTQAVIDNFDEYLESLSQDDKLSSHCIFSADHEKRMSTLFAREKRKINITAASKWVKRVAAVIFIAVSILFGSLMFVPEVRATVIDTVVEWFDQFTRFTSRSTEATKSNLEPTFIPEGFIEEYRYKTDFQTIILYINNYGIEIDFMSTPINAQHSVDNEGYEYEVVRYNTIDYHIFTSIDLEKVNFIIWEEEGARFQVGSTISMDILFVIALSVK